MSSKTVTLQVNNSDVPLSFFVQTFFDRVLDGMVGSLENAGPVDTLTLEADKEEVSLTVNGAPVALNEFVRNIVRKTAFGMISSLRGVDKIDTFVISIVSGE